MIGSRSHGVFKFRKPLISLGTLKLICGLAAVRQAVPHSSGHLHHLCLQLPSDNLPRDSLGGLFLSV